jgi:SAM-dependent methyltransferase
MDWHAWHSAYDTPDSRLRQRLRTVQERITLALDEAPPGPLRALSVCAGQGRDLLGALAGHPRRHEVTARLVELDERNVAEARRTAARLGLDRVEVVCGDAADTGRYADLAPAGLVLLCGLFGNVTAEDIARTVGYCERLCATGGTLVWTRNRKQPDRFPWICELLEQRGFDRVWLNSSNVRQGVGVHRFTGVPKPLVAGERMFTFIGYDALPGAGWTP